MRLELVVSSEEKHILDQFKAWGWLEIPQDADVTLKPDGEVVVTVVDTAKAKGPEFSEISKQAFQDAADLREEKDRAVS
jgi:hypothetical protein